MKTVDICFCRVLKLRMREYGGNIHFIRLEAQTLTFETGLLLGQVAGTRNL